MKCWICDKELEENARQALYGDRQRRGSRMALPRETGRWYCEDCLKKELEVLNKKRAEYGKLRSELMLERAVKLLEDNVADIYEYKEIINDMEAYVIGNSEKFESADEMIAAMMLVANGIHATMQYKIKNYRVDFYIPELRVVLEVDGERHQSTKAEMRDSRRDKAIRAELGDEWEVIRVPTDILEENPERMLEAIIVAKQERQRLRAKYNGELPYNYSRTSS